MSQPANNSAPPAKEFRKWRRIHGLQLPLHPQQVISWVFLLSFTVYIFLTLIPAIHSSAQLPLLLLNLTVFGVHYVSHLTSLLIDPSDPALLALYSNKPVPQLDKSRFRHVIENGRCHLCEINITTVRTKHCSVCNKCVHVFDHHCKWLNQCIGRRNYLPFFICVVSAILMCLSFITLAVTEMTLYFSSRQLLSPWQHPSLYEANITTIPDFDSLSTTSRPLSGPPGRNSTATARSLFVNTNQPSPETPGLGHTVQNNSLSYGLFPLSPNTLHLFLFPVPGSVFLTVTSLFTLVAVLCAGLLLHLCIFHIYINVTGMTTYEYVRAQRLSAQNSQREEIVEEPQSSEPQQSKCQCCISKDLILSKSNKIQPSAKDQTESGNYLKFGDKKVSGNIRNIQARPSSVPRLPSISQSRPSTNGLRKLQQHLESVQEDNEDEDCAS